MAIYAKKGIFRRFIDAIKRLFGIKTKEEREAEEQSLDENDEALSGGGSDLAKLSEEMGIMKAPEGYEEEEKNTETKKSGSSPMIVVPSSDAPKKSTEEKAEFVKTEKVVEESGEKAK